MPGRLPSILRRRDDAPVDPEPPTAVASDAAAAAAPAPSPAAAPTDAPTAAHAIEPAAVQAPAAPGGAPATTPAAPVAATAPEAGAGDPAVAEELPPLSPGFRDRGRLRRRLRYLREVRELGYRDLGGLVFDLHRFARSGDELVRGKLEALAAVDRELRALARAVDDRQEYVDLRQAGVAACPRCAALHGSEANFCPACGLALDGSSVGAAGVATAEPAPGERVPPPVQVPLWGTGQQPAVPTPADRPHAPAQPLFGGGAASPDAATQAHAPATTDGRTTPPPGAPGA